MFKIIMHVQGMMCPKCEARVNKAVQDAFSVQSVVSSHKKGTTEVICAENVDAAAVQGAIEAAGYAVTSVVRKKKGLFGLWV